MSMKAETLRKLMLGYVISLLLLFAFGAVVDHGRARAASAVGVLLLLIMFAIIDYSGMEEEEAGARAKDTRARGKYTRMPGKESQA